MNSHLRAGDADREQMAAELGRHCADGRLTADELSERLDTAYRARTLGELATLASDLPRTAPRFRTPARRTHAVLALTILGVVVLATVGLLQVLVESPEAALVGLALLALAALVLAAVLIPVLIAAAPFMAVVVAAVWAVRRWGGVERPRPTVHGGR